MVQTEEILRPLRAIHPNKEFVIVPIIPEGDKRKTAQLLSMARGMFVKDIEDALLSKEIDFAVHSAKDLTATLPDGLTLAAFGERMDPRDVVVNKWDLPFDQLPSGARLGTSSPRRTSQLKALRSDVEILPVRGNVGTRLEKGRGEEYDGVVLAAAGLIRMDWQDQITEYLPTEICTPAVGQGALAVETRASDSDTIETLAQIDHRATSIAVRSERSFLETIGGGCKVPVAAYARLESGVLRISAMAAVPDGSRMFRIDITADADDPEQAGRRAAESLMEAGAAEIVARGWSS